MLFFIDPLVLSDVALPILLPSGIEDVKFDTSSYGPEGRTIPTLKVAAPIPTPLTLSYLCITYDLTVRNGCGLPYASNIPER